MRRWNVFGLMLATLGATVRPSFAQAPLVFEPVKSAAQAKSAPPAAPATTVAAPTATSPVVPPVTAAVTEDEPTPQLQPVPPQPTAEAEVSTPEELRRQYLEILQQKVDLMSDAELRAGLHMTNKEISDLRATRLFEEARRTLQQLVKLYPDTPTADEARRMLNIRPTSTTPVAPVSTGESTVPIRKGQTQTTKSPETSSHEPRKIEKPLTEPRPLESEPKPIPTTTRPTLPSNARPPKFNEPTPAR